MHQHKPSPSTHLPILKPISSHAGYADYLAELAHELPFSASQFGIVLVSALELRDRQNQDRDSKSRDPERTTTVTWEPNLDSPHSRCSLPVQDATGKDVFTTVDVTIAGHASTIYTRDEYSLMQAASRAGFEGGAIDGHYSFKATAENFSKAAKSDPVIQGHQNNVVAVMKEILDHPVANKTPPGQDKAGLQYLYCLNEIWIPALKTFGKLSDGNRAVKHVITEEELLKADPEIRRRCQELEEKEGLTLGPMVESDIPLMIELNGVKYDDEYGRFIIKRSLCFRNKKGEMVAWAGTHGDFSIAALHVLPEYRKTGLGRLVLHGLAMTHIKLAREILATRGDVAESVSATTLVAHADCMDYNQATMIFMERCGWRRIGFYLWIGVDKNTKEK
ncbi:hypothetical protein EC957_000267 [Mortierella hygrophila]|uniref:N-acetyltransferase domain-containing protein n=1 Tax=Mortierella hygrophila TaxID=979708 RepID=A0A9P6K3F5_9FUNG|nr:hypothetical protein EC957_000267 [Mortierella hygrophila]